MPVAQIFNCLFRSRKSIKIAVLSMSFAACISSCHSEQGAEQSLPANKTTEAAIKPGIVKVDSLAHSLKGKTLGVVTNHTGQLGGVHLIDTLLSLKADINKVFAPEHGFRGKVPDGEKIKDNTDPETGLPVVSLYGNTKKPSSGMLRNIDVVIFDIQDVGARFYTYLSTLHYVMEAGAENNIPVIVLDRPNPNGFYIDGPVLEKAHSSFVGLHPVPVVYGMTIGEYAQMINGEGWLKNQAQCELTVITCQGYTHSSRYKLPVKPSPNLPGMAAIYWYPSLCFFEGTNVSVGRGTEAPFTRIGEPGNIDGNFSFTPRSMSGASVHPKHEGVKCTGYNLRPQADEDGVGKQLQLKWLIKMYSESPDKKNFFKDNGYFELLAGTSALRQAIIDGRSAEQIRNSWRDELDAFKKIRGKYLLYDE
jgi:uncharacterized protein YbbC (DUF1343 family)